MKNIRIIWETLSLVSLLVVGISLCILSSIYIVQERDTFAWIVGGLAIALGLMCTYQGMIEVYEKSQMSTVPMPRSQLNYQLGRTCCYRGNSVPICNNYAKFVISHQYMDDSLRVMYRSLSMLSNTCRDSGVIYTCNEHVYNFLNLFPYQRLEVIIL